MERFYLQTYKTKSVRISGIFGDITTKILFLHVGVMSYILAFTEFNLVHQEPRSYFGLPSVTSLTFNTSSSLQPTYTLILPASPWTHRPQRVTSSQTNISQNFTDKLKNKLLNVHLIQRRSQI